MSEQVTEQAQPEAVVEGSQDQPQEEFGIFTPEEPAAPAPAVEPVAEPAPANEGYEEVSKLTAQLLDQKGQIEEMRALLEAEKDEATDELGILDELLGDQDERTPEEKRIADLESQLSSFREEHQQSVEELRLAQQTSWATNEVAKIESATQALSEELPWVAVAKKVNPNYSDLVLRRAAEYSTNGEDKTYHDIIRESNDVIQNEYMSLLDQMLSVPSAKQALIGKLKEGAQNSAATPAAPTAPAPTLSGDMSAFAEQAVKEYDDDQEAFNAAVKMMEAAGRSSG